MLRNQFVMKDKILVRWLCLTDVNNIRVVKGTYWIMKSRRSCALDMSTICRWQMFHSCASLTCLSGEGSCMMAFLKRSRLVAILVSAKGSGGKLVSVILLLLMYIAQLPCYLSIFFNSDWYSAKYCHQIWHPISSHSSENKMTLILKVTKWPWSPFSAFFSKFWKC